MDRFSWTEGQLIDGECLVTYQSGVRLYDGEDKVLFTVERYLVPVHID